MKVRLTRFAENELKGNEFLLKMEVKVRDSAANESKGNDFCCK
jgi:hypothetical protein